MSDRLDLSSDYWTVPHAHAVVRTNGCRVNLEHQAKVLAARQLAAHNREQSNTLEPVS